MCSRLWQIVLPSAISGPIFHQKILSKSIFIFVFFIVATPLVASQVNNPKYDRDSLSGEYRCRRVRAEIEAFNDQLIQTTRFRRDELARQAKECGIQYIRLNR